MPDLVIIRLYPQKVTDAGTFANDLVGLTITIYDRSVPDPSGTAAGNLIGSASTAAGTIVQNFFPPTFVIQAATATAAIEPPAMQPPTFPGYPEYVASDLRLSITRGAQTLVDTSLNYNIALDTIDPLPAPNDAVAYAALGPVALYLALPHSSVGLDPSRAFVGLPADGTPPNYADLYSGVTKVLAADPTKSPAPPLDAQIMALTPTQCRHIAYEIIWNRDLNPLPDPPSPLEDLYTTGAGGSDSDRQQFEGDLATYYTTYNTQAETLAKYVFALSTALICEQKTVDAPNAGFEIPVLPGVAGSGGKTDETDVILS